MNTKQLLEQLLNASKDIAEKGQNLAEDKLNIPKQGPEREKALGKIKKSAAAAAVVGILLGTKSGRKLTGTAIKFGSLAAIGGIGFKAYKNWKDKTSDISIDELGHREAEERSLLLLKAMVAAANADGHIDEKEQDIIKQEILDMHLPEELIDTVEAIIEKPLNALEVAKQVDGNVAAASEVYLVTRIFINNEASDIEKNYLKTLRDKLNLDSVWVEELENEISKSAKV